VSDLSVETVISRRLSIHYGDYYSNTPVPWELVSKILWAAYGYTKHGRTTPTLSNHPIIIYICNETGAYKFVPENQTFTLWKNGDYRELGGGYFAPIQLFITFDTNLCQDIHWGNAESGLAVQNIYLAANSLNLGTVCQGGTWLDRTYIHQGLGLPENEKALYKMPLGYPLPPYVDYQNLRTTTRPSSSELPEIQDSNVSFEGALNSVRSRHEWSDKPVTRQELSQVLWASYGYSYYEDTAVSPPRKHRTVPSASSYYPMRIYVANSSGIYQYLPEQHTLTPIVTVDRRANIATASGNTWASSAPIIILIVWDDSHILTVDTTYIEIGLITQNVYLESAAWGLVTDWGRADADEEAMRNSLGLSGQTNLHPVSIITVGHPPVDDILPMIFNLTQEPPEDVPAYQNVTVEVNVTDAGSGLHNVTLWYSIDNGTTWMPLNMVEIATTLYQTTIPGHKNCTWVTYKIIAYDNNGNQATDDNHGDYYSYHVVPEFQTLILILLALLILTLAIATYKRKFLRRSKSYSMSKVTPLFEEALPVAEQIENFRFSKYRL
jgi:SagB-type dehydrogenase family enzyme